MLQIGISFLSPRKTWEKHRGFDQQEWQKEETGEEVDYFSKSSVGIPTNFNTSTLAEAGLRGDHHISDYLLSTKGLI